MPLQPSAAPPPDWHVRIEEECYRALAVARPAAQAVDADATGDADASGDDATPLNAYEWMSFDIGPTLLSWLEREAPTTPGAPPGAPGPRKPRPP